MSRGKWLFWLAVLCMGVSAMAAAQAQVEEGTTRAEWAASKPPAPSEVSVVVLPVWAENRRHTMLAMGSVMLNLRRHGFQVLPEEKSLPAVAAKVEEAYKADTQHEPGTRVALADAVRLGKHFGARWVVYGEVEELETTYHRRIFRTRRVAGITLRLVVADVESGLVIFWRKVKDHGSGDTGFWNAKATSIERRMMTRTMNRLFDDIAGGLPRHPTLTEVTQEDLQDFVEAMGL